MLPIATSANASLSRQERGAAGPGRPDAAELGEDVAHLEEVGGGEPVRHEVEHADARVAVVAEPLLLQALVERKVVRDIIGPGARALTTVELVLLVLEVPPGRRA